MPNTSAYSKKASEGIKSTNRKNIYQVLRSHSNLTRQSLVNILSLSLPTVVQNLKEMQKEGLVQNGEFQSNTGGRRAMTYSIVADYRVAVGVDVTKNHFSVVIVNLQGDAIASERINQVFSPSKEYYKKVGDAILSLINDSDIEYEKVMGVGVCLPGLISSDGTSCYYCKVLNAEDIKSKNFASYLPFRVVLVHDTIAATYAESYADPKNKNFFYFMLSQSIGGSLVLNGSVYYGLHTRSGEIGHVQLVPNGEKCYCGNLGCADSYCSEKPLVAITRGNLDRFFQLLDQKDQQALKVWDQYLSNLSILINDVHMLFDCNIVLGGHIGDKIDKYMNQLKKKLLAREPFVKKIDYISVSKNGSEASALGAALSFIEDFVSTI